MQLLDAEGNALWQPDGILVADRNYSSVMDFDLGLDHALEQSLQLWQAFR